MPADAVHVSANLTWVMMGLFFALMITIAVSKSRRQMASTDLKLCKSCGTSHPPFARFCRKCGKNLGE
jgi:ribosomal protein L40E